MRKLALLYLMACSTSWAHGAEEGCPSGHWCPDLSWYAGAGVGQSRFDHYQVPDDGSLTSRNDDDGDTFLRLFGGMAIGRHVALEVAYADFGEASSRVQSDGSGTFFNAGPQAEAIEADGYDVSLMARLPLGDNWSLFGRVGQTWWDAEVSFSVDGPCCGSFRQEGTFSDSAHGVTYGGGVHYDGLRPLRIIGEYGAFPFEPEFNDKATLDWMAISVAYLF